MQGSVVENGGNVSVIEIISMLPRLCGDECKGLIEWTLFYENYQYCYMM